MPIHPVIAGVGMIPFGKFPDLTLSDMASTAARLRLPMQALAPMPLMPCSRPTDLPGC